MNFCVIDVETTGLINGLNRKDGQRTHEIVQLAVCQIDENYKITDKFLSKIRPLNEDNISPEAMKVNGLSLTDLRKAPMPMAVRASFYEWATSLGEKIFPIGWNYYFDKGFLTAFFGVADYEAMFRYHCIDVQSIFTNMLYNTNKLKDYHNDRHSLIDVANHFKAIHKAHDAFGDVYATIEILKELNRRING